MPNDGLLEGRNLLLRLANEIDCINRSRRGWVKRVTETIHVHGKLAKTVVSCRVAFGRRGQESLEGIHVGVKPSNEELRSFSNPRYRGTHRDTCRIECGSCDSRRTAREPHRHEDERGRWHVANHDRIPVCRHLRWNPELEFVRMVVERNAHRKVSVEWWRRSEIRSPDERVHECGYHRIPAPVRTGLDRELEDHPLRLRQLNRDSECGMIEQIPSIVPDGGFGRVHEVDVEFVRVVDVFESILARMPEIAATIR